jgi:hypothetical protein
MPSDSPISDALGWWYWELVAAEPLDPIEQGALDLRECGRRVPEATREHVSSDAACALHDLVAMLPKLSDGRLVDSMCASNRAVRAAPRGAEFAYDLEPLLVGQACALTARHLNL